MLRRVFLKAMLAAPITATLKFSSAPESWLDELGVAGIREDVRLAILNIEPTKIPLATKFKPYDYTAPVSQWTRDTLYPVDTVLIQRKK